MERAQMNHTRIASQSQVHIHVQSKIDDFFGRFKIATLMHCCGVRKHHEYDYAPSTINWQPRIPLEEGLVHTIADFEKFMASITN
jgi:hypothetical protein